jgi:hypothetical protein
MSKTIGCKSGSELSSKGNHTSIPSINRINQSINQSLSTTRSTSYDLAVVDPDTLPLPVELQ